MRVKLTKEQHRAVMRATRGFSQNLRGEMTARGITKKELTTRLDLKSSAAVTGLLSGREVPSLAMIVKVAMALGVEPYQLIVADILP